MTNNDSAELREAIEYFKDRIDDYWESSMTSMHEEAERLETLIHHAQKPADVERLKKGIATAAVCLLKPNEGICDTIWLDKFQTLYEHLVSYLDVELTGDVDKDISLLSTVTQGKGW